MLGWPGSVFSTLIMQSLSEEERKHGSSTVKPQCLGSRWSEGGTVFVTLLQTNPPCPMGG